jgi:hypothetical protein
MSATKLLGLPETENSIIVRAEASCARRVPPRIALQGRTAAEDGTTDTPHRVLRSLIAGRKIGEKK